jgi:4-hydroxybenzoate polyprenyltransferase
MFSVACNDLADEAIDRVNLPGDRRRPLVTGATTRRELATIGVTAAAVALAVAATLGWAALAVTAAGLAVSAGYSLRPVRIADRGAVASMVLPACYVAVPYLLGLLAGGRGVRPADLALLAGLYLGFIGRILLKDFRDVRGDALFGKRTFLVRHGRRRTCALGAACWVVGTALLLGAVRELTVGLLAVELALAALALVLLKMLAADPGRRREEAVISAIAITGRGMILALLTHLASLSTMDNRWWPAAAGALCLAQALLMWRTGPRGRRTVPPALVAEVERAGQVVGPSSASRPCSMA